MARLAALGLFAFELATLPFAQLTRTTGWRHAANPRIGAPDALQYVGPDAEKITLAGILMPEAAGSPASIATLREMAGTGEAFRFVAGTGEVWGAYIVEKVDERQDVLLDNGVPRKIDFAVDLRRVDG